MIIETIVRGSGLDWVIARPPILKDGPATGEVLVLGDDETGHSITRADVAVWLVDQLESNTYVGHAVVIANS